MKNKLKTVFIIITAIIIVYAGYVTVDCIRLRKSEIGTQPIITTGTTQTDNGTKYFGPGYTVEYYTETVSDSSNTLVKCPESLGYGAEFRLFNKFLVWAWVT